MQGESDLNTWARQIGADVQLQLHVQPGARASAVTGVYGARLKVAVNAPPVEGKANEALLDLLADLLQCPRRRLRVERGSASRDKTVSVEGAQAGDVIRRLLERDASRRAIGKPK
jgi:hypothetical protein